MNIDDKLRKEVAVPLTDLLKKFVDVRDRNSQINFYTGKVVDNNDPDKLGRCKIRVYGVFEKEILDTELPWAIPDFNFIGSELGSFIVPPEKTILKVYFDNNDYHTPRYTTKVIDTNNLDFEADKDDDYPNTMVFFETEGGEYFKINRLTKTSTYRHASGTKIIIDIDGNINIDNKGATEAKGNLVINIEGNTTLNCGGNIDAIASGDASVQGKNVTIKSEDGSLWQPNTVSKCFFNGAHHGGPASGTGLGPPILSIKGETI